jgi:hypothetical protein
MDGPTAQIAALAIAGNYWLKGGDLGRFWPDSPVFNFCKYVHFITLSGDDEKRIEHPYTDDYSSWLARQKGEGVLAFRLIHMAVNKPLISDRMSAGLVGGGGRRLIEAIHAKTMDGWEAGWRVGNQKDPDRKIWEVNYARIGQGLERRDIIPYNLTSMVHALEKTLGRILAFARAQKQDTWIPYFEEGLAALASKTPLTQSFNFKGCEAMLPDLRAQKILAASDAAWVFGAMGSWNDLGFDGEAQKEYEETSDKLFQEMIDSITTAVNSTFDAPRAD